MTASTATPTPQTVPGVNYGAGLSYIPNTPPAPTQPATNQGIPGPNYDPATGTGYNPASSGPAATSDTYRAGVSNTGAAISNGLNSNVANTLLSGIDTSGITNDYNTAKGNVTAQQGNLATQRDQELANINTSFDLQKTALNRTQANETGNQSATLARIGGYLGDNASGMGAAISLQNLHVQQMQSLEQKRQAALLQATQAFNDNNYKLAQELVTESQNYQSQMLAAQKQFADQKLQEATNQREQQTADLAKQKQETDLMNAARDFAVLHGIAKPAYLVGNTAVNTATGERLSLGQYQQLTGQQVGLPESETDFSQLETNIQPTGKYTSTTDAFGNPITFNTQTGRFEDQNGNPVNANTVPTTPNGNGVTYEQYGLLANTDFNPGNQVDRYANLYLDRYLKSGSEPSARTLGLGTKANLGTIAQRANDLYFKATGQALPTPEIIQSNQALIASNNKLANNLKIQEQTVTNNVDLSLQNLKSNNLNATGFKPLDNFLNTVNDMFNDPATGQLIAQNTTIQNELGSLLAVKNASGTTVYDKLSSAGIITKTDNESQIRAKVSALLKEATNFADSINTANADLYKQIDPLEQSANNPNRVQHLGPQTLEDYVKANPNAVDKIDQLHSLYPNYTDPELLQILQGSQSTGGGTSPSGNKVDINKALNSGGLASEGGGSHNALSRTDRNNNPTAMTTDVAREMGLVYGKDYTTGDKFPDSNLHTAKLLGDPIATTIKAIDNGGFQTASGKDRWSYLASIPQARNWRQLSFSQKKSVVKQMYQQEGGTKLLSAFA